MDNESYEIGHRDGESSVSADWRIALSEFSCIEFPLDFGYGPMETVTYINDYIGQFEGVL